MGALKGISVLVLTYNHENFIEQCLRGIADQDYPGPMEVVVFDDASTDETARRIRKFAEKAPDIPITLHVNELNLGAARNFEKALAACSMPYLAFCEGDDFWILPEKLSRQAGILDSEPDTTTMVYTNYAKTDESGAIIANSTLNEQPEYFTFKDLMLDHGPSTNAVMMRRDALRNPFPEAFRTVPNPDIFIFSAALLNGRAKYLDFSASAYRLHNGGIWSSRSATEQKLIRLSSRLTVIKSLPKRERTKFKEIEMQLSHEFAKSMRKLAETGDLLFNDYAEHLSTKNIRIIALRKKLRSWKNSAVQKGRRDQ